MRKNLAALLFITIILLHIATGIFSLRMWPFTDYPMFNTPIEGPPVKIERLLLVDHFEDGTSRQWVRTDYRILGVADQRLHWAFRKKDYEALRSRLEVLVKEREYDLRPVRIEVLLKTVLVVDGERREHLAPVVEYKIEDLLSH